MQRGWKYIVVLITMLMFAPKLFAQAEIGKQVENGRILSLKEVFDLVFEFHPLAMQANLLSDKARFQLNAARGFFDPSLQSFADKKVFQGNEYFTIWQNELKVPTWAGIDLKAGYEWNQGPFLNRQLAVPEQGLFYAGVSIPIGQGMIIDQRRAVVRQAQAFTHIAEAERLLLLNNLLLRVAMDYWDWMYQFNRFRLFQAGYEVAMVRLNAVTERIKYGDLASIDSVEAAIEVQQRRQFLGQSRVDYQNSMLRLSNHLWGENQVPLEISENILPQDALADTARVSLQDLEQMILRAGDTHPIIQTYRYKIAQQEIEWRYKANLLLPKIELNLNALQHPVTFNPENLTPGNYSNNYKAGGSFSFPLLVRRQRNELKLAKLYIQEAELDLQQKTREVSNKIRAVYNEMANLESLLQTQETMVVNYTLLRDGEEIRFRNGESSLFLINNRERQLIEAQVKYYEFRSKFALSVTKLVWETGTLATEN